MHRLLPVLVTVVVAVLPPARAEEVDKSLFLVFESGEVIASNTLLGRFDSLDLAAREEVLDYREANAVAVIVTNQRFAGYGVLAGGWQSLRRRAGENHESLRAADWSATVVTDGRILSFNGRTGAWRQVRRSVQFPR